GSVIDTLVKDFEYENHITAIEIDPVIIEIAKEEFNLSENKNLKIICADAYDFINQNKDLFDLVIVDLFIDNLVPHKFYVPFFWEDITNSNSINGSILFNASLNNANYKYLINIVSHLEKNNYQTQKLEKVNGTNTLLIAERSRL
ncbi:MAG: spermine synthase, partial [Bacteroidia bacterium]|nr:spermine synthase [Bacteroidia bacterium]